MNLIELHFLECECPYSQIDEFVQLKIHIYPTDPSCDTPTTACSVNNEFKHEIISLFKNTREDRLQV